jgi:hypothetical protein
LSHRARGHVEKERRLAGQRDADADRVGAEAPVGAAVSRDAGERDDVDEVQRNEPFCHRHLGPMPNAAEVMRVAERGKRQAVLLRALDGHARRLQADRLPIAGASIQREERAPVELHLQLAVRMQPALEQRLDIARHHADAVRIVAGQVGGDEVFRDELRFRGFAAAGGGNRGDGLG